MDADLGTGGSTIIRMRMRMRMRKGEARCTGLTLGFLHLAGLWFPPAHNTPGLSLSCSSQDPHQAPNQPEMPMGSRRTRLGEMPRLGSGGLRWSSRSETIATARLDGEMGTPQTLTDINKLLPSDSTTISLCHHVLRELCLE